VWATGEASASLGFAAARLFDVVDPMEKEKDAVFVEQGVVGARKQMRAFRKAEADALEFLKQETLPETSRDAARYEELKNNVIIQYALLDAQAAVLCPACKLWNTGYGATMMREAVSLMGGYGITEDCPGFLGQKWMDAQLEATYEGPEAVQRRQLSITMTHPLFLAQFCQWARDMRGIANTHPGTGACTLATAMYLWVWTLEHLQKGKDAADKPLYHTSRQGVTFPLADALCWLLASRQQILDVLELGEKGPETALDAEGLAGTVAFLTDLCHVQAAHGAGESARVCAELVYGYLQHPSWNKETEGALYSNEELGALETLVPGLESYAAGHGEALDGNGKHPEKAGPCVTFQGYDQFVALRTKLDGCLTGARLAKDRAAQSLIEVMIPEALDYPL